MSGHALIENNDKYLVTRRSNNVSYMPGKWDIPGGKVEAGESVEETTKREIKEETGLTINIGKPLFIYSNKDQIPTRQTFQAIYQCRYSGGTITLNKEHSEYRWLNYSEISKLDTIAFLKALLEYLGK
jgi:8-oxo-dGTP diphosphatase